MLELGAVAQAIPSRPREAASYTAQLSYVSYLGRTKYPKDSIQFAWIFHPGREVVVRHKELLCARLSRFVPCFNFNSWGIFPQGGMFLEQIQWPRPDTSWKRSTWRGAQRGSQRAPCL